MNTKGPKVLLCGSAKLVLTSQWNTKKIRHLGIASVKILGLKLAKHASSRVSGTNFKMKGGLLNKLIRCPSTVQSTQTEKF